MFPVVLEIKTRCESCGRQLAVNAFVPRIYCFACGHPQQFPPDFWRLVLDDVFDEVEEFEEGEGSKGSMMMKYGTVNFLYGKRWPELIEKNAGGEITKIKVAGPDMFRPGVCKDSTSGERPFFWREAPRQVADIFPLVKYLSMEDPALLQISSDTVAEVSPKNCPFSFLCEQCGAPIPVNRKNRNLECEHCGTSSIVPDEIWATFHPSSKVNRWYLWVDTSESLPKWDYVSDFVSDDRGNFYLTYAIDEWHDVRIASFDANFKPRWILDGFADELDYNKNFPRLSLDKKGRLLVWHTGGILVLLEADTGEKSPDSPDDRAIENITRDAVNLSLDHDGSIFRMGLHPSTKMNDQSFSVSFTRFDLAGNTLPTWPGVPEYVPSKVSAFKKALALLIETERKSPDLENLENLHAPIVFRRRDTTWEEMQMRIGPDGSYFFAGWKYVARFNKQGGKVHCMVFDNDYPNYPICPGVDGSVYFFRNLSGNQSIFKISPDGQKAAFLDVPKKSREILDSQQLLTASGKTVVAVGEEKQICTINEKGVLTIIRRP